MFLVLKIDFKFEGMYKIAEEFYTTHKAIPGVFIKTKTNGFLRIFIISISKTKGWSMGFIEALENYLAKI